MISLISAFTAQLPAGITLHTLRMTAVLRIRFRCPPLYPSPVQLEGCTAQTTFVEFQGLVLKALGLELDGDAPTILAGFPPKPLDLQKDEAIGSALSDNENVTVRLASQSAAGANPEGGKWGRSGRSKRSTSTSTTTTTTSSPSTTGGMRRASTRTPKPNPSSGKTSVSPASGDGGGGRVSAPPSPAGKNKKKGKGKTNEKKPGTSTTGSSRAKVLGAASNKSGKGGVHTLAGPAVTPSASRSGAAASANRAGGRGSTSGGSPPGQVRTLSGTTRNSGPNTGSNSSNSPARGVTMATLESAVAGESGEPARKRARVGTGLALKSEGDIAERLLQAVEGGGKGTADRFFRKAMKLAVDKQYDQSRADNRVRAALGGWYTAECSAMQRRLGDGESVAVKISFSKGDGAKSMLEETVDRIPRAQVAAVVRMIARDPDSREMLKPHNFAGCSPRMFWSLVEYWGGDVPRALRLAAPDVDWSFIDTRNRKPSEKAIANAIAEETERREAEEERAEKERAKEAKIMERERKKKRRKGIPTDSSDEEHRAAAPSSSTTSGEKPSVAGAAAAAAVSVDSPTKGAPEELAARTADDARQRAANAALARLAASQGRSTSDISATEAHAEEDLEKGASSILAVSPTVSRALEAATARQERGIIPEEKAQPEEAEREKEEEVDMEGLTDIAGEAGARLLAAAGVRTLGHLADRDEEELACELDALQKGCMGSPSTASETGVSAEEKKVDPEEVSEWVQGARGEELDEIMADIVGGDEDLVEALEKVAVSTPRDLVRLGAFPDVLIGAVKDQLGTEHFAPLESRITTQAVEEWRREGDRLLEQRPWLELWVHEG